MAKSGKVIITCAVTGAIHTPTMSPYLPLTPDEVAEQAISAAEAGAAILHLHARDPKDGRPTPDPAVFMQFLPRIKQATDAVINITTGGGLGMTLAERLAAPVKASPEMCSLNMGSINFGLYPMLNRYKEFKHPWEKPYLEGTRDFVFKNTFADIEGTLKTLDEGHGTRFEFECYDVGHLYNLAHFLAAGRHKLPFVTMGAVMGGNVRVGLEDSLYIGKGQLAKTNAEQVSRIRSILENLSLEIASPTEARQMLALKGGDRVTF